MLNFTTPILDCWWQWGSKTSLHNERTFSKPPKKGLDPRKAFLSFIIPQPQALWGHKVHSLCSSQVVKESLLSEML